MRCLYEVLGVEASAEDSAIRSAYRKLALVYHPDKNQENPAAAEERFKEIQNAYEILSDKQERAWYDSHRTAILRSGERHQAGTAGEGMGERPDDYVDVYEYFTSTCYSGFGDGPRGFYTVYDNLFTTLSEQEANAAAARAEKRGSSANSKLPSFGLSGAPWSEVGPFYAEWSSFVSAKDFSWADEYNPASAPNRKVRRAMEQENEKKRKAARKEYNEGVRALVDFLRKRDKRVAAHQVEEAKRRQEREAADAARREAERQERLARAAQYQAAEWARSDSSEGESEEEDTLEEQLLWYCPVCEKHFKSEGSLANHEKSKKHKEEVELLRFELEAKEAEFGGVELDTIAESNEDGASDGGAVQDNRLSDSEVSEDIHGDSESEGLMEDQTDEDIIESNQVDMATAGAAQQPSDELESEEEEEDHHLDEDEMLATLINSRVSLSRNNLHEDPDSDSEEEDAAEAAAELKEEKEVAEPAAREEIMPEAAAAELLLGGGAASSDEDDWGTKKTKRKGKRAKGGEVQQHRQQPVQQAQPPVQQPVQPPIPQKKEQKAKGGKAKKAAALAKSTAATQDNGLSCSICGATFDSRNKLFKHISQTGHAQLK